MSSSVPNSPAHFYEGRIPRPAMVDTLPRDTREERRGEGSAEDSDEDDYEPMNPGVTAADIEVWEERRKSVSLPSQRTGQPKVDPVHYTKVIVPASEKSSTKPTLAKIQQHAAGGKRNPTLISYTPVFYSKQGIYYYAGCMCSWYSHWGLHGKYCLSL